jgi:hypothetical protein
MLLCASVVNTRVLWHDRRFLNATLVSHVPHAVVFLNRATANAMIKNV